MLPKICLVPIELHHARQEITYIRCYFVALAPGKKTCLYSCRLIATKVSDKNMSMLLSVRFSMITCSQETVSRKNTYLSPKQIMSLHVGVETSDVVDTNLAPAGSRLPLTRSKAFCGKYSNHFWAKRSWAMVKLFNDFANMFGSRQTISWNLKIRSLKIKLEQVWMCTTCKNILNVKPEQVWTCYIGESLRLPWSSQSFQVLGLIWNGGKFWFLYCRDMQRL